MKRDGRRSVCYLTKTATGGWELRGDKTTQGPSVRPDNTPTRAWPGPIPVWTASPTCFKTSKKLPSPGSGLDYMTASTVMATRAVVAKKQPTLAPEDERRAPRAKPKSIGG